MTNIKTPQTHTKYCNIIRRNKSIKQRIKHTKNRERNKQQRNKQQKHKQKTNKTNKAANKAHKHHTKTQNIIY